MKTKQKKQTLKQTLNTIKRMQKIQEQCDNEPNLESRLSSLEERTEKLEKKQEGNLAWIKATAHYHLEPKQECTNTKEEREEIKRKIESILSGVFYSAEAEGYDNEYLSADDDAEQILALLDK